MNEIEVGEYVRDTEGKIYKIESETLNDFFCIEISSKVNLLKLLSDLDIQKPPSKNILDLIEVGDYVNGVRILDITGDYIHTSEFDCCKSRLNAKLKLIVTKEQVASVEYRVSEVKK